MDYNQFMKLMEPGDSSGNDAINKLQEYVNEFPYFQSAHTLLAKTMHKQQHVRYERQLKIAAAYSGDRKILYEVIHPQFTRTTTEQPTPIDTSFNNRPVTDFIGGSNLFVDTENVTVFPPVEDDFIQDTPSAKETEINQPPIYNREENEYIADIPDDYDEPTSADPHEIIKRRLIEILGLKDEVKEHIAPPAASENTEIAASEIPPAPIQEKQVEKIELISDESQNTEPKKDMIERLADESARALDFIDKAELEYALEASLIQSLEKLPVIEKKEVPQKPPDELAIQNEHSFNDWLSILTVSGFGKIEEVHAYDSTEIQNPEPDPVQLMEKEQIILPEKEEIKSKDADQLIERFIKTDPKIIPSKSEFYSPANQAKKSITENEDIVSETLAKIYYKQGNLLKARLSYLKLSLFYPEKKAYFAALISEIDKEINNLDKKDL